MERPSGAPGDTTRRRSSRKVSHAEQIQENLSKNELRASELRRTRTLAAVLLGVDEETIAKRQEARRESTEIKQQKASGKMLTASSLVALENSVMQDSMQLQERRSGSRASIGSQLSERRDSRPWFEIKEEAVTDAEAQMAKIVVMHRETRLVEEWGRSSRRLIELLAAEQRFVDKQEEREYAQRVDDLIVEQEAEMLRMESIAAVVNPNERRRLKKLERAEFVKTERNLHLSIDQERQRLLLDVWRGRAKREADLRGCFQAGPALVTKFGDMLSRASANLVAEQKKALVTRLHEEGISLGRVKASDAANQLHRKITLNPLDVSPYVRLANGDLTMSHTAPPSGEPLWGIARSTEGPWQIRRTDRPVVRDLINDVLETTSYTSVLTTTRILARLLDAAHPSVSLHAAVLASPSKSKEIVQRRLAHLGYSCKPPLHTLQDDVLYKAAVVDVLGQMDARLERSSRFYFEVNPMTEGQWVVGWTTNPLSRCDHPGLDAESFGFASTGLVWFNGQARQYATLNASKVKVFGLLADLSTGSLSAYADGEDLGIAFGVDADTSMEEQKTQADLVRNKQLIPSFALLGRNSGRSSKLIPRRATIRNVDSALAYWSHMRDTVQQQRNSTPTVATEAIAKVSKAIGVGKTPKSKFIASNFVDHLQKTVDESEFLPTLNINFGAYPFVHVPDNSYPCDAFLSIVAQPQNLSNNEQLLLNQAASYKRSGLAKTVDMGAMQEFFSDLHHDKVESWSKFPPTITSTVRSVIRIQRVMKRHIRRAKMTVHRNAVLDAVNRIQRWVRPKLPRIRRRRRQAALVIQTYWRGYRARQLVAISREFGRPIQELVKSAIVLQRWWRRSRTVETSRRLANVVLREMRSFIRHIVLIQRAWRRFLARRAAAEQDRAARILQRHVRGHLARAALSTSQRARLGLAGRRYVESRDQVRREAAAVAIQAIWNGYSARKRVAAKRSRETSGARRIQALWRGVRARASIADLLSYEDTMFLQAMMARLRAANGDIRRYRPSGMGPSRRHSIVPQPPVNGAPPSNAAPRQRRSVYQPATSNTLEAKALHSRRPSQQALLPSGRRESSAHSAAVDARALEDVLLRVPKGT